MNNSPLRRPRKAKEGRRNLFKLLLGFFFLLAASAGKAQNELSPDQISILRNAYANIKHPELSFEKFVEVNAHVFATYGNAGNRSVAALAQQDPYCSKVRLYCTNGDFETGLDQNQWVGAYGYDYTGIYPDPFAHTYGFSSGSLSDNNAHQTIVTAGSDPYTAIPMVAANGGTKALRLGNSVWGNGTEMIAKTIVVDPNETILSFYYAVVFEDPGHPFNDQPAFSVRAYDCATGTELPNVCDLGNGTNVVVSDAANPFFKSTNYGSIAYRDWSLAQINLSAYVGKTVTIIFTNKDCNYGGHFGYTYLDNVFSNQCPIGGPVLTGQGSITLNKKNSATCGIGSICVDYTLPASNNTTGSTKITLDIYQAGAKVTTLTSPVLTVGNSYCFAIDPGTLGLNTSLPGFDYSVTGTFVLSGFALAPLTLGSPPNGQLNGANNDYQLTCIATPVYYSKPTGDLHNVLTWGLNPDGSGANPANFDDSTFQLANRSGDYTMTGDWIVGGTINIPTGKYLVIGGNTLSVANTIEGFGELAGFNTSNVTVLGTNGGNLTLNLSPLANDLNNLTLNRTGSGASLSLANNNLNISGVLTVMAGTFNTGGKLLLRSTAATTARVAPVTGSIVGDVTVERYMPARRAWRILSAPVGGLQTINQAWQEGAVLGQSANANPAPGYGMHITGGSTYGTVDNGFDQNQFGAASSIKRYNSGINNWEFLQNTNSTAVGGTAYMTFVRGDRGISLSYNNVPPTPTTLRASGPLRVGDQTFTVSGTGFTAIANPFASPINFATITRNGVQNNFYLWDPKMGTTGAYVLLSYNGSGYDVLPASVSPESQYIQSGQGFLVQPMVNGVPGSLTIRESDKSATPAQDVFRTAGVQPLRQESLRITLKATGDEVLDEAMVSYNSRFSNGLDNMDAAKPANVNENLAIESGGRELMLERRTQAKAGDVLQLKLWNTQPQTYVLEVATSALVFGDQEARIEDQYLHTFVPLAANTATSLRFSVGSDPASGRADRFRIVVGKQIIVQAGKPHFGAYPNPLTGSVINLQLDNVEKGVYQVALVSSNGNVVYAKTCQFTSGTSIERLQLPKKPVAGAYQLRILGNGTVTSIPIVVN